MGSEDDALANACIVPPGGTGNFSAFSPNQWGANTLTSNTVCTGVDDRGDAQKLVYITPSFAGFQFTGVVHAEWRRRASRSTASARISACRSTTTANPATTCRLYVTYSYEGDGWGLTAGGGASFEGHVEQAPGPDRDEQDFYQAGLNLTFGNFSVGGVFEYFNDSRSTRVDDNIDDLGRGRRYRLHASTRSRSVCSTRTADSDDDGAMAGEFTQDRVVLTGNYAMGPGINIDAELGYTWVDVDPRWRRTSAATHRQLQCPRNRHWHQHHLLRSGAHPGQPTGGELIGGAGNRSPFSLRPSLSNSQPDCGAKDTDCDPFAGPLESIGLTRA